MLRLLLLRLLIIIIRVTLIMSLTIRLVRSHLIRIRLRNGYTRRMNRSLFLFRLLSNLWWLLIRVHDMVRVLLRWVVGLLGIIGVMLRWVVLLLDLRRVVMLLLLELRWVVRLWLLLGLRWVVLWLLLGIDVRILLNLGRRVGLGLGLSSVGIHGEFGKGGLIGDEEEEEGDDVCRFIRAARGYHLEFESTRFDA
ncbi:hypothetical protein Hanom_Chr09g00777401 [Helianthus anomalus]